MDGERQLLDVIENIYAAAVDSKRMSALVAQIAPLLGTDSSILFSVRKASDELRPVPTLAALYSSTSDMHSWGGDEYRDYYHDRNEWFLRGSKKPRPAIVLGQELISDKDFERTEFQADWCQRIDIFHVLGASFEIGGELSGAIGFHRARRFDSFSESDRTRMSVLLPHLQRSLQIHSCVHAIGHDHVASLNVLESLTLGIVIAGSEGQILHANLVAERVLKTAEGLTVYHGRLRPQDSRCNSALAKAIGEAANTSSGKGFSAGGIIPLPRASGGSMTVLVSPLRSEAVGYGPERPAALVVFSDPDETARIPADILARAFNLTPAESRLVASLIAGETLSSYAEQNKLSLNTAKTHLKQVFQKTGHSRQIDLVRAILSDPVFKLTFSPLK